LILFGVGNVDWKGGRSWAVRFVGKLFWAAGDKVLLVWADGSVDWLGTGSAIGGLRVVWAKGQWQE